MPEGSEGNLLGISNLLSIVRTTTGTACEKDGRSDRQGLIVIIQDDKATPGSIPVFATRVGVLDDVRAETCSNFAREKAERLGNHPHHVSSLQSADESKGQYGGAVRVGGYIISCSNLDPLLDEAAALMMAYEPGLAGAEKIEEIARISGNSEFVRSEW